MDLKKKKDGTAHVAKSPPKTFQENNWNYKHALSVVFHSNSSPKSSIIIFINGVRFSSESENKDFSLEICFFPTSLLVPSNGIQGGEDVPEYRRKKKKIPTYNPRSSNTGLCGWSGRSGAAQWPLFLHLSGCWHSIACHVSDGRHSLQKKKKKKKS